jgi:hypothetical protein
MSVGIEGNFDAGVPHLVANVGGSFALGNQLAGEEVSQVMKASPCHTSLFCNGLPNLCVELVRINETCAIAWKYESAVGFPNLQVGQYLHDAFGRRDAA